VDLPLALRALGVALQETADHHDRIGRALSGRQHVLAALQVEDLALERQQRLLVLLREKANEPQVEDEGLTDQGLGHGGHTLPVSCWLIQA
jgi:hypothetical protein